MLVWSGVSYGQEVGNEPGVKGLQPYEIEVTAADGAQDVSLAAFGIPPIAGTWFPVLQVMGGKPYTAQAQNITQDGFTVRLFRPDGAARRGCVFRRHGMRNRP